jgi:hypothetical protein
MIICVRINIHITLKEIYLLTLKPVPGERERVEALNLKNKDVIVCCVVRTIAPLRGL